MPKFSFFFIRFEAGNFDLIQSTTRITDFLVVDKSSVILVKRPKIR